MEKEYNTNWDQIFKEIRTALGFESTDQLPPMQAGSENSFRVLIGTIISLRTRDEVTFEATDRLFAVAEDPKSILNMDHGEIEELIYPAGFYRNKAQTILEISRRLMEEYNGKVPDTFNELTGLKGVGPKTANLVLSYSFGKPAIVVDVHVNRIPNRLGWIETQKPEASEKELKKIVPRRLWGDLNPLLVTFGQRICTPVSPKCSECPLNEQCPKVGVEKSR